METKTIYSRLSEIQSTLKAPKGQTNEFGHYKYRSCEDILESVKPLLKGLVLTIGDDVVLVGDRYYIKATANITDGLAAISNTAFARESFDKKGMDDSQITGTASSYARKYALNGLFAIDDTKDADTMDNTKGDTKKAPVAPKTTAPSVKEEPVEGGAYCEEHKCNVAKSVSKATGKDYYFCPNETTTSKAAKIWYKGRQTDGHFVDDPNKINDDYMPSDIDRGDAPVRNAEPEKVEEVTENIY